jgi:hypothetical protein
MVTRSKRFHAEPMVAATERFLHEGDPNLGGRILMSELKLRPPKATT